ncbi:hypothetical protein QFC22_005149 [Naganishia vaughanmartiniae]|uniref:Uncharacterized protein n=1 Tax=Naganishia vaughanmartiniae TaxID=1424756 RepID=A0ACC2WW87_9TREE|nr:hypothetical protein QFC22_005149 [Naganishia vaughanmartiniae]
MSTSTVAPTFRFREINPHMAGAVHASAKDSALIVIDAQNFYLRDGDWPVHDILETNKTIEALVEKYRQAGGEVIWVVHTGDNTSTLESIKGTPFDCIGDLRPKGNEKFISKAQGSSFVDTDLDEYLKAKGIKNIVLAGYQPQFCIITTAVYGQHLGYRVFVVRDAIGSHNLRSWDDKRNISGSDLVDSACDLMSDALAVVIEAKDIQF